jgi:DNA-binding FadR family transcriptional regulator
VRNARTRRRGLHGELVGQLGQAFADGTFAADEVLAPETLGERFGVSRTVVREALRVLEAKGMVSARQNVGTKVRPVSDWNLLDPDVIEWRAHGPQQQEQARQLLELRSALEPFAARLAARHGGDETVQRLRTAEDAMMAALRANDIPAFTRADLDFHAALLGASHNGMFDQLSVTVAAALRIREELLARADHLSEGAVELHGKVVDAIAARDENAAEVAMRTVIESVTHELDEQAVSHGRSPT